MGVVYEAADQKLGRHVAVKFLTEATRNDQLALERFWREARAASSLNHPGICTIYELNESAETPFIVMELLEGNSLEKLSPGRPLPCAQLVELGIQVADALDAAHRKGILHRDIKPANIFLTNSGQAKLLDFGVAKLTDTPLDSSGGLDPDTPTAVDPLTRSGSSVGTIAYMSPEQARGEPLDARSDLFSLGVVLYEMATGRHPFPGGTNALVFDRILNHPPIAPITLNAQLPQEFENILNKTLEKDRDLRCQTASELRADLKRLQRKSSSGNVSASNSTAPLSPPSVSLRPAKDNAAGGSRKPAIFVGFLIFLLAAGLALWRLWPRPQPFASISVQQITNTGTVENIALSADGRFLAEVKNEQGQRTLWIRNIATNTDTQILEAFGNYYVGLAFTPDGNYLYFTRATADNGSERSLYAMPVFGGVPKQLIYDIDSTVSFAPDGKHFIYVRWTPDRKDQFSELHVADKDASSDQVIYTSPKRISSPAWSPDGSRIAWTQSENGNALVWMDIASKRVNRLPRPADVSFGGGLRTSLAWLPDNRHLLARYFNAKSDRNQIAVVTVPSGEFRSTTNDVNGYSELALSGDGRTLATVLTNISSSLASYSAEGGAPTATVPLRISPTAIAWTSENRLLFLIPGVSLGFINRSTGAVQTFDLGTIRIGDWFDACRDGHILFTNYPAPGVDARLFRMNADGGEITQLTNEGVARAPFCSADSKDVYFSLRKGGESSLWVASLQGGPPKQLLPGNSSIAIAVSRDGIVAASVLAEHQKFAASIVDVRSGRLFAQFPIEESVANYLLYFSPDDRAVVYPVLRNNGHTLLSQPIDGSASKAILDPVTEVITAFSWSPSGKQLAVVRLKSSSDVVLITEQGGKTKD